MSPQGYWEIKVHTSVYCTWYDDDDHNDDEDDEDDDDDVEKNV